MLTAQLIKPPVPRVSSPPVGVLLQCTNLGGMEKVAYTLFDRLQSRGFQFKISSARPWGPGRAQVLAVDATAAAHDYQGKFGWRSFPAFRRHTVEQCAASEHVWVIGNCVSCLTAARLLGRKTLLSHHYHHFENRLSWARWTAFYLAFGGSLEAITYPTDFTRNEAIRIAPRLRKKMHVVRNGFDVYYTTEAQRIEDRRAARKKLGIPEDAFVVGNGGWLIRRKRFDVFLNTARHVIGKIPSALFYICGGGPEEPSLRRLAQELGIDHRVRFTGWVPDLTQYYQAWDALLFNTDFDALGCSPLEAASHGCVCVASCRYGGLSEFLKDGETGFFMKEHEPHKLAEPLVRLARNPWLGLALRQRAATTLELKFSNRAALAFYENYFRNGQA
jgi:glycosyltransferase involved in cell wall biosynthesis